MPGTTDQTRLTRCWKLMTEEERRGFWQRGMAYIEKIDTRIVWIDSEIELNVLRQTKGHYIPAPCPAVWWRIEEMMGMFFHGIQRSAIAGKWRYVHTGDWDKTFHTDRSTALLMAFEAWLEGREENRGG